MMIKPSKPSKISVNWQKIADETKDEDNQDAVTTAEFAEMIDKSHPTAYRRLLGMVKDGKAIKTTKRSGNRYVVAFALVTK